MTVKFCLIVAVCQNMGIGKNNTLPWRLKSEMAYFNRMTSNTIDAEKKNIVIMGRKTWDSIGNNMKPLKNRINFVLSRSDLDLKSYKDTYSFKNLESCLEKLENTEFKKFYESVWIVGGTKVYEDAMKSRNFYRLYLTNVMKTFDVDTFFPPIPENLKKVSDPTVPEEVQHENGIDFTYNIYENPEFGK